MCAVSIIDTNENGSKQLKAGENGWKHVKQVKTCQTVQNGQKMSNGSKQSKQVKTSEKRWKKVNMVEKGWKRVKKGENGWKRLKMNESECSEKDQGFYWQLNVGINHLNSSGKDIFFSQAEGWKRFFSSSPVETPYLTDPV